MGILSTQYYDLNTVPGGSALRVRCSQGDTGRKIVLNIYDVDREFSIPNGATATVNGKKPNNVGFSHLCEISGNSVSFTLQYDMVDVYGVVVAEISFTDTDSSVLGTANFIIDVERSTLDDDVLVGESRPNLIAELIADIQAKLAVITGDFNDYIDVITQSYNAFKQEINNTVSTISTTVNNFISNISSTINTLRSDVDTNTGNISTNSSNITSLTSRMNASEKLDTMYHITSAGDPTGESIFAKGDGELYVYRFNAITHMYGTFTPKSNVAAYSTIIQFPSGGSAYSVYPRQRVYFPDQAGNIFMLTTTGTIQNVTPLTANTNHSFGFSFLNRYDIDGNGFAVTEK